MVQPCSVQGLISQGRGSRHTPPLDLASPCASHWGLLQTQAPPFLTLSAAEKTQGRLLPLRPKECSLCEKVWVGETFLQRALRVWQASPCALA